MKRNLNIIALIFIVLFLVSCAGTQDTTGPSFIESQYKALTFAQETYNTSWGSFKEIYDMKLRKDDGTLIIDDETYQKSLKLANTYYDAWMAWMDAVIEYEKFKRYDDVVTIQEKLVLFQKASKKLLDMIRPFIE